MPVPKGANLVMQSGAPVSKPPPSPEISPAQMRAVYMRGVAPKPASAQPASAQPAPPAINAIAAQPTSLSSPNPISTAPITQPSKATQLATPQLTADQQSLLTWFNNGLLPSNSWISMAQAQQLFQAAIASGLSSKDTETAIMTAIAAKQGNWGAGGISSYIKGYYAGKTPAWAGLAQQLYSSVQNAPPYVAPSSTYSLQGPGWGVTLDSEQALADAQAAIKSGNYTVSGNSLVIQSASGNINIPLGSYQGAVNAANAITSGKATVNAMINLPNGGQITGSGISAASNGNLKVSVGPDGRYQIVDVNTGTVVYTAATAAQAQAALQIINPAKLSYGPVGGGGQTPYSNVPSYYNVGKQYFYSQTSAQAYLRGQPLIQVTTVNGTPIYGTGAEASKANPNTIISDTSGAYWLGGKSFASLAALSQANPNMPITGSGNVVYYGGQRYSSMTTLANSYISSPAAQTNPYGAPSASNKYYSVSVGGQTRYFQSKADAQNYMQATFGLGSGVSLVQVAQVGTTPIYGTQQEYQANLVATIQQSGSSGGYTVPSITDTNGTPIVFANKALASAAAQAWATGDSKTVNVILNNPQQQQFGYVQMANAGSQQKNGTYAVSINGTTYVFSNQQEAESLVPKMLSGQSVNLFQGANGQYVSTSAWEVLNPAAAWLQNNSGQTVSANSFLKNIPANSSIWQGQSASSLYSFLQQHPDATLAVGANGVTVSQSYLDALQAQNQAALQTIMNGVNKSINKNNGTFVPSDVQNVSGVIDVTPNGPSGLGGLSIGGQALQGSFEYSQGYIIHTKYGDITIPTNAAQIPKAIIAPTPPITGFNPVTALGKDISKIPILGQLSNALISGFVNPIVSGAESAPSTLAQWGQTGMPHWMPSALSYGRSTLSYGRKNPVSNALIARFVDPVISGAQSVPSVLSEWGNTWIPKLVSEGPNVAAQAVPYLAKGGAYAIAPFVSLVAFARGQNPRTVVNYGLNNKVSPQAKQVMGQVLFNSFLIGAGIGFAPAAVGEFGATEGAVAAARAEQGIIGGITVGRTALGAGSMLALNTALAPAPTPQYQALQSQNQKLTARIDSTTLGQGHTDGTLTKQINALKSQLASMSPSDPNYSSTSTQLNGLISQYNTLSVKQQDIQQVLQQAQYQGFGYSYLPAIFQSNLLTSKGRSQYASAVANGFNVQSMQNSLLMGVGFTYAFAPLSGLLGEGASGVSGAARRVATGGLTNVGLSIPMTAAQGQNPFNPGGLIYNFGLGSVMGGANEALPSIMRAGGSIGGAFKASGLDYLRGTNLGTMLDVMSGPTEATARSIGTGVKEYSGKAASAFVAPIRADYLYTMRRTNNALNFLDNYVVGAGRTIGESIGTAAGRAVKPITTPIRNAADVLPAFKSLGGQLLGEGRAAVSGAISPLTEAVRPLGTTLGRAYDILPARTSDLIGLTGHSMRDTIQGFLGGFGYGSKAPAIWGIESTMALNPETEFKLNLGLTKTYHGIQNAVEQMDVYGRVGAATGAISDLALGNRYYLGGKYAGEQLASGAARVASGAARVGSEVSSDVSVGLKNIYAHNVGGPVYGGHAFFGQNIGRLFSATETGASIIGDYVRQTSISGVPSELRGMVSDTYFRNVKAPAAEIKSLVASINKALHSITAEGRNQYDGTDVANQLADIYGGNIPTELSRLATRRPDLVARAIAGVKADLTGVSPKDQAAYVATAIDRVLSGALKRSTTGPLNLHQLDINVDERAALINRLSSPSLDNFISGYNSLISDITDLGIGQPRRTSGNDSSLKQFGFSAPESSISRNGLPTYYSPADIAQAQRPIDVSNISRQTSLVPKDDILRQYGGIIRNFTKTSDRILSSGQQAPEATNTPSVYGFKLSPPAARFTSAEESAYYENVMIPQLNKLRDLMGDAVSKVVALRKVDISAGTEGNIHNNWINDVIMKMYAGKSWADILRDTENSQLFTKEEAQGLIRTFKNMVAKAGMPKASPITPTDWSKVLQDMNTAKRTQAKRSSGYAPSTSEGESTNVQTGGSNTVLLKPEDTTTKTENITKTETQPENKNETPPRRSPVPSTESDFFYQFFTRPPNSGGPRMGFPSAPTMTDGGRRGSLLGITSVPSRQAGVGTNGMLSYLNSINLGIRTNIRPSISELYGTAQRPTTSQIIRQGISPIQSERLGLGEALGFDTAQLFGHIFDFGLGFQYKYAQAQQYKYAPQYQYQFAQVPQYQYQFDQSFKQLFQYEWPPPEENKFPPPPLPLPVPAASKSGGPSTTGPLGAYGYGLLHHRISYNILADIGGVLSNRTRNSQPSASPIRVPTQRTSVRRQSPAPVASPQATKPVARPASRTATARPQPRGWGFGVTQTRMMTKGGGGFKDPGVVFNSALFSASRMIQMGSNFRDPGLMSSGGGFGISKSVKSGGGFKDPGLVTGSSRFGVSGSVNMGTTFKDPGLVTGSSKFGATKNMPMGTTFRDPGLVTGKSKFGTTGNVVGNAIKGDKTMNLLFGVTQ